MRGRSAGVLGMRGLLFGCSKNTVRKWRDRFAQARQHHPHRPVEEALRDAERSGRPPEFSEVQLVALMSLATADPQTVGEPSSRWSCADLARVAVETGRFPHLSKSGVLARLRWTAAAMEK